MKFPFGRPLIGNEEKKAVKDVLSGNILVHGPKSKQFEDIFCKYTGASYAVSVSSCTAGMHLVYFTLGIGVGDEVLVPAQTHVATAHAIELTGAKPIFVDSNIDNGNVNIDSIEKLITRKTRAIAVVHYLGIPVDMYKINKIAKKYNLYVIEDCALALGAKINNRHVGLFGDVGVFSFYPVKHITTSEGGMIISNNFSLVKKLKLTRAFGVNKIFSERIVSGSYDCVRLGFNYRMSEINCAIGIEQIKKFKSFLKKRKNNFRKIFNILKKDKNLYLVDSKNSFLKSSYYCFVVILDKEISKFRNKIIQKLNFKGVGTSIYYPNPVPFMSYYQKKYKINKKNFVNANIFSQRSISLPVGPHLSSKDVISLAKIFLNVTKSFREN